MHHSNGILVRRRAVHDLCPQAEDGPDGHWAREGNAVEREELDMSTGEQARICEAQLLSEQDR